MGHIRRNSISVADAISERSRLGKSFSIVAMAEGVISKQEHETLLVNRKDKVAGKVKTVPPDHPWILSARNIGTNMGD